jgi:hypothetical protein
LSEPGQETAVEEAEALELDKEVVVATDVDVDMELPEAELESEVEADVRDEELEESASLAPHIPAALAAAPKLLLR